MLADVQMAYLMYKKNQTIKNLTLWEFYGHLLSAQSPDG